MARRSYKLTQQTGKKINSMETEIKTTDIFERLHETEKLFCKATPKPTK